MKTSEIATELVTLLKKGQFEQAQKSLFANNAVSIEPEASNIPTFSGLDAILKKGEQFRASVEAWHGIEVSDAVVSSNHFSISLKIDLTYKGQEPTSLDEIIVYQVEDGKIVQEQFFY